ncbi:DNA polymerase III beta subunit [Aurantimonas phage AmM-1]|uniref:DNA polymerase processivity factor n=1 Tax=Aurantimonas phage AmM-1 TaxID=1503929 RepID=UPI00054080D7|nr:DNA polymerase processivity factor [Aurantimonas phage AmM-1]BAP94507.1 DNA polymerase III beta subunit [Aurantimonas phage AmM-1]
MAVDFTVPRDTFRPLVEQVRKVVEKRNTVPILGNVRIEAAQDGRLTLTGTDLDLWATATSAPTCAHVHTPGGTTVPAGLLFDILRKATGEVRFADTGAGRVTLGAGRSKFTLHALPVEDFPDMSAGEASARFTLPPAALTRIADCCSFAISSEETRYYLNGIYLHPHEGALVAVATDGHRLSRLAMARDNLPDFAGIIVPRKMVSLFGMMAEATKAGETVQVAIDQSRIVLEAGDLRLASKLIDGTYPDYQRVIPKANPITADVPREALADAIERVTTISSERGRGVNFAFAAETLRLSIADPAAGSAEDEIACGFPADKDLTIGFNGRYCRDALGTFTGERMTLAMADPGAPAVLTDPADEDRLVVLMPMRVSATGGG